MAKRGSPNKSTTPKASAKIQADPARFGGAKVVPHGPAPENRSASHAKAHRMRKKAGNTLASPSMALPPEVTSRTPMPQSPSPIVSKAATPAPPSLQKPKNTSIKIVLPRTLDKRDRTVPAPYTRPPGDGSCLLLDHLPGELRNRIYNETVNGAFVAEGGFQFWIKGTRKAFTLDKSKPADVLRHVAAQNMSLFTTDREHEDIFDFQDVIKILSTMIPNLPESVRHRSTNRQQWQMDKSKRLLTPADPAYFNLLFICKTMYAEVLPIVYSKCVFAVRHQWRLRELLFDHWTPTKAMSVLRPRQYPKLSTPFPMASLEWIKSICLEVDSHNQPKLTEMIPCEYRYYSEWERTIDKLVDLLTGLENVSLFVHVPHRAPCVAARLSLAEIWVRPLAGFRHAQSLKTAAIRLDSPTNPFPEVLNAFGEYLRRWILKWDEQSALEAIQFGKDEYLKVSPEAKTFELDAWRQIFRINSIEDAASPKPKYSDI